MKKARKILALNDIKKHMSENVSNHIGDDKNGVNDEPDLTLSLRKQG
jgi:hypothetical protein